MIFVVGNFRNMPHTVAERYQLQDFAKGQMVENSNVNVSSGDMLCIGFEQTEPVFGRVQALENGFATVGLVAAVYDYHMHAYEVIAELGDRRHVALSTLRYPLALALFKDIYGNAYICPRYVLY